MFARAIRLIQCLTCWHTPRKNGNPDDAQLVVTQACSNLRGGHTSRTNMAIASMAKALSQNHNIGIWAQGEVARALEKLGATCVGSTPVQSVTSPNEEGYLDTYAVAKLTADYCDENGITCVLLAQYSPHVWRVKWCLKKLKLTVIIPKGLPKIQFEPEFEQQRLSKWWTFYPFELLARLYYLWKDYI